VPIGYRQAHAAVQNAELALARQRAIQHEQQREIVSNLNGAIADADRAWQAVQNNLNQYLAARDYVKVLETRADDKQTDGADRILDAHRRVLQSELQFFRARAEYAVALKNVHFEKGSLLTYRDLRVQGGSTFETQTFVQADDESSEVFQALGDLNADETSEVANNAASADERKVPVRTVSATKRKPSAKD